LIAWPPIRDPEVVLERAAGLPYGGTWQGHQGVQRFMTVMSRAWDEFDITGREYFVHSDTVAVLNQIHARARATGTELSAHPLKA
jgi:uncharacterized protein